jgi:Subtilase family
MIKKLYPLCALLAIEPCLLAQNSPESLAPILAEKGRAQQAKFDQIQARKTNKSTKINQNDFPKAHFGGFLGQIPVPVMPADANANTAHGVSVVQSGGLANHAQIPADANQQRTLNGDNIRIAVFDEGAIAKHTEFGNLPNRITILDQNILNGMSTPIAANYHPTFVAGIIGNSGLSAARKGVLPNCLFDSYSIYNSLNETTKITRFQKLNQSTAAISNHSWGLPHGWSLEGGLWYWRDANITQDRYSGAYSEDEQQFDQIVYANPYKTIIKSAGNSFGKGPTINDRSNTRKFDPNIGEDGAFVPFADTDVLPPSNCSQGYNCLPNSSAAKNIVVVGASNPLPNNTYTSAADVVHASYSSAGPRRDGGIKPDITAVGNYSSNHYNPANPTALSGYGSNLGTSFSAPMVTGVAGLLTELNQKLAQNSNLSLRADQMKLLLCHTAKAAGTHPGPDAHFGWGLLDAANAASTLIKSYNQQAIFELLDRENESADTLLELTALGNEDLKISMAWVDPAATINTPKVVTDPADTSSRLVNDLDMTLSPIDNPNQNLLPWRLNTQNPMQAEQGDNTVDNFEQIVVEQPVAGQRYQLRIKHKNTLQDATGNPAPQHYALLITGATESQTLGLKPTESATKTQVYPSICTDVLYVINPENAPIRLMDTQGNLLQNLQAEALMKIDMNAYAPGLYVIEVLNAKKQSFKVIKK